MGSTQTKYTNLENSIYLEDGKSKTIIIGEDHVQNQVDYSSYLASHIQYFKDWNIILELPPNVNTIKNKGMNNPVFLNLPNVKKIDNLRSLDVIDVIINVVNILCFEGGIQAGYNYNNLNAVQLFEEIKKMDSSLELLKDIITFESKLFNVMKNFYDPNFNDMLMSVGEIMMKFENLVNNWNYSFKEIPHIDKINSILGSIDEIHELIIKNIPKEKFDAILAMYEKYDDTSNILLDLINKRFNTKFDTRVNNDILDVSTVFQYLFDLEFYKEFLGRKENNLIICGGAHSYAIAEFIKTFGFQTIAQYKQSDDLNEYIQKIKISNSIPSIDAIRNLMLTIQNNSLFVNGGEIFQISWIIIFIIVLLIVLWILNLFPEVLGKNKI